MKKCTIEGEDRPLIFFRQCDDDDSGNINDINDKHMDDKHMDDNNYLDFTEHGFDNLIIPLILLLLV